ncbi:MAG: serine/threonine protein kinase [Myxococcales bacterium]|nr:serine/threonine protein kinase [Myxococcales bacterium]MBL0197390.1 serine/threonine protein kinase [Myxococcales bacterium]HQY63866.1 serine/threonine-protein kinase [Polyangiaceae bacterium]
MARDPDGDTLHIVGGPAQAPPSAGADPYLGTVIEGRYLVDSVLGEGGMGIVYAGRHRTLAKRVAIKVLKRELADDRDMLERFFNEARAASSIGSPHIADVADFGMLPDGAAYFVMEYLDGVSLGGLLDQLRMIPTPRLLKIARQMAVGLSAAHAAGIVHRDLKPDNIMLVSRGGENDFVKILDFGIAKVTHAATRLTRTGSVFGTPHYMSPEQAAGLSVDSRGDLYAMGIILYEMACGRVPFDSDNYMGILTQHMYKAPPAPRTLVVPPNAVSPGLEAIILKCLTKKPEGRYATADELVADLDLLLAGQPPKAVGELMARSGNFNAPADYFHGAAASTMLPQSRGGGGRLGIALGLGMGVLLAIAAVVAFALRDKGAGAQPTIRALAPPPSASTSAAVAVVVASAAPVVTKRVVIVAIEPVDAQVALPSGTLVHVERGFAHVSLAPGESVKLTVSRAGYARQELVVGPASADAERVALAAEPKAPVGVTTAHPTAPRVAPPPPSASAAPPPPKQRPEWCAKMKTSDPTFRHFPECR